MKANHVQYYVEGKDEVKLINVLKSDMGIIKAGKVQQLNVIEQEIKPLHLRTLTMGTMVVLVFDTDTGALGLLKKNIETLKACKAVSDVILVPQVSNLEDELVRSCNIRKIEELLNSQSKSDFKSDFIRVSNLAQKLQEHKFDMHVFWSSKPVGAYKDIPNQSEKVKLIKQ